MDTSMVQLVGRSRSLHDESAIQSDTSLISCFPCRPTGRWLRKLTRLRLPNRLRAKARRLLCCCCSVNKSRHDPDSGGGGGGFVALNASPVSRSGGRRGGPGGTGYGRPLSAVGGSCSAGCSPAISRHSAVLPPPPPEFLLPDICEFNPGAVTAAQYASSSVLDDSGSLDEDGMQALRTRSLPSSVRNKQKPLASEEDLDQLYAKVNFSKKRKNRMRHDEAAIIAISKSRSQFLDKMANDTDTLVENEAVIVYNERTAL